MRANAATFAGAFFIALLYSTKPDSNQPAILRAGTDTVAAAADTVAAKPVPTTDSAHYEPSPDSAYGILESAEPVVVQPSDIDALRSQNPVVPVAGVAAKDLVDSFGDARSKTRRHNALDIMADRNTPAIAATSGTVLKLHTSVAGGLTVYLTDPTKRFVMMYGHLDSYRPGLAEGAAVKRGEIIGFVGTTGNASPLAPHLHFQLMRSDNPKEWWKGTPINPFPIYRPAD